MLVIGGTGLIGGYVLQRLVAAGYAVDVLARGGRAPTTPQATLLQADLTDEHWINAVADFGRYQSVVYLAYATHLDPASNRRITVDALHTVLDALARTHHQPHLVYLGSMVVFGAPTTATVTEASPQSVESVYAQNKLDACRKVLQPPPGVTTTVLHPTGVYDATSPRIRSYRQLLERNYIPPSTQLGINNIIHADDVAAAIVQCLRPPTTAPAEQYIVTGEALPYPDWFEQLSTTVPKQCWLRLPAASRHLIRGPLRHLCNQLGLECPAHLNLQTGAPLTRRAVFNSDKARRDFGFAPTRTFAEMCRQLQARAA